MDEALKARELIRLASGKVPGDRDVLELGFTDAEGGSLSVTIPFDMMLPLVEAVTAARAGINRRANTFDALALTGLEVKPLTDDRFLAFEVQFRKRGRMHFALPRQAALRFGAKLIERTVLAPPAKAPSTPPAITVPTPPAQTPSKRQRVAKKSLQ